MRRIVQRRLFRSDFQQQMRRGCDADELFAVVDMLAEDGGLPDAYRPHMLTGAWKGVWECHIEPDWLLIYEVAADEVILHRTGTHEDLFD
jgi:mRNA interferase YafQ